MDAKSLPRMFLAESWQHYNKRMKWHIDGEPILVVCMQKCLEAYITVHNGAAKRCYWCGIIRMHVMVHNGASVRRPYSTRCTWECGGVTL